MQYEILLYREIHLFVDLRKYNILVLFFQTDSVIHDIYNMMHV